MLETYSLDTPETSLYQEPTQVQHGWVDVCTITFAQISTGNPVSVHLMLHDLQGRRGH